MNTYVDIVIDQLFRELKRKHPKLKIIENNFFAGSIDSEGVEKLDNFHGCIAMEIFDKFLEEKSSEEIFYLCNEIRHKMIDYIESKMTDKTNSFYCHPSTMFRIEKEREIFRLATILTVGFRFALGSSLFKPQTVTPFNLISLPVLQTSLPLPD